MADIRFQPISTLDLPELAPYRSLKRSAEHEALGIFVVEGDKVLLRMLESHFTVVSVLLQKERLAEFEPLLRARAEKEIIVYVCEKSVMTELVGFEIYQGVLAIGKIPSTASLEELLANNSPPKLFVAADGLSNAENIGVLMRNCLAFGVQALIIGETCSSPYLRRSVRNSMGAVFKLPVLESKNLVQTLRALQAQGIRCVAAHPHTEKRYLSQADFKSDTCILFGSEGDGISKAVLDLCDEAVAIPMANDVDSLNVSAAAAAFLYEAQRQRRQ